MYDCYKSASPNEFRKITERCPFFRSNVDNMKEDESLNLTSAIWFAWGVLLNSGIGDPNPVSLKAMLLTVRQCVFFYRKS